MQQYLSRTQLAEAMGMSTETIRRLTKAHKIPFYRVGNSYRYDLQAVLTARTDDQQDTEQAQKSALLG